MELLENKSFVEGLPEVLLNLYLTDNQVEFQKYILQLKKGLRFSHFACDNVLLITSEVIKKLPDSALEFYLLQLLTLSTQFLRTESKVSSSLGVGFSQMKKVLLILLRSNDWQKAIPFLEITAQILQGLLEKSPQFVEMVRKLRDNVATKEVLETITGRYLCSEISEQKTAAQALLFLGRRAVIFLVNTLFRAEKSSEKDLLVSILAGYDREAYTVFNDCLGKTNSTVVVRNILKIYEKTGDDEAYQYVRPYLNHKDIMVQQYVLHCIAAFDRKRAKARILEAVHMVNDALKPQLVMQLGVFDGEDVEQCLQEIVANRSLITRSVYDHLLGITSLALKSFPSEKTVKELSTLLEELYDNATKHHHLIYTIENTLNYVRPIVRHELKGGKGFGDEVSFDETSDNTTKKSNQAKAIEEEALLLIQGGQIDQATNFVVEHIKSFARKKEFGIAQYLQNKLLSINPMALEEVIAAEEFIENEKLLPVSAGSFSLLEDFQQSFANEECNALLEYLWSERYDAGEAIVRAGEIDPCLFFIDTGQVNIECDSHGRSLFLKKMKTGEIIGVGTFFSCAVWTYTLTANTDCMLHVLSRQNYNEFLAQFPAFDQKFQQFCSKFDIVAELIKIAGKDRREYPRFKVVRLIQCRILDSYGKSGNKRFLKGDLDDISQTGLSYLISVSDKINPMLLLGKMVECSIPTPQKDIAYTVVGTIVAAKDLKTSENKFSIHVKFQDSLKQNEIREITQ